jgi:hypothetical protein
MNKIERLKTILLTLPYLGLFNLFRVLWHRTKIRFGLYPIAYLENYPQGIMFSTCITQEKPLVTIELLLFGWMPYRVENLPKWHENPINPKEKINSIIGWPEALNSLKGRDAKPFWEISRFDWAAQWALHARLGDSSALITLNSWIGDWIKKNPPYLGINWTCGQEASIRVLNLALCEMILGHKTAPSPLLVWFIEASVRRIRSTLNYAIGQDNNHGSIEACALFIAGTWGDQWNMPHADEIAQVGKRWLQNRALRLIQSDGSPSQYSTNYHRANLETFCAAELWGRYVNKLPFKKDHLNRIAEGARWLHHITNPCNGDAPNLGANDGSHLFNIEQSAYRDFRPTVSLAARLFDNAIAYSDFDFNDTRANLFELPTATQSWVTKGVQNYDDGGFHVIRKGQVLVVLRYPRFRFRPSQADALHLDLWLGCDNLLRDDGSYDYSIDPTGLNYFGGTASHNTVQFDSCDQMPRLSRFLYGKWLKTSKLEMHTEVENSSYIGTGYRGRRGSSHFRCVTLKNTSMQVTDEVQGFARKAVLRWRLMPGNWKFHQSQEGASLTLSNGCAIKLNVSANVPIRRCEIVQGWESRHYLEKTPVPVLEVEIQQAGIFMTELHWVA